MSKENQQRNEAFVAGVEAMRKHIADQFAKYNPAIQQFSGPEIASIVRRCAPPPVPTSAALPSGVAS